MPPDGYFSFAYSGLSGIGCGFFELLDGELRGRDYAQGSYKGHVIEDGDGLLLELDMTVPPNASLMSGGAAQEIPVTRRLSVRLPDDFDNGQPVPVEAPGDIILLIHRLTEEWEPFGAVASTRGFSIALNAA